MLIKQLPQDFIVEEISDLKKIQQKEEDLKNDYFYFELEKVNYSQIRAIEKISNVFNVSRKRIHFAGTKDKVGVTRQLISISGLNENKFQENLDYFNKNIDDMKLIYLGKFKQRINLGDNLGNKFIITVRDLTQENIDIAKRNLNLIKKNGVKNYFDSQRFGYANNSHIVGKYILQNEVEKAVYEILTSLPKEPTKDLENFVNEVKEHWNEIKSQDINVINNIIELAPKFLSAEKQMLLHLTKHKNDFPGAFRRIHKKQRTLYVNAYQSYIFNEILDNLSFEELNKIKELQLYNENSSFDKKIQEIINKILENDDLKQDYFLLKSMPELKLRNFYRKTIICPRNLKLSSKIDDELNQEKFKLEVSFELDAGEYATNMIKNLFKENL